MKNPTLASCAAAALMISGCSSPLKEDTFAPRPAAKEVLRAEALFSNGQVGDAIFACVDIARKDPDTAGLASLQTKIQKYLAAHRTAEFETVNNSTHAVGMSDVQRYRNIPLTFNQRRHIKGETDSLKSEPTEMQKTLRSNVTMDLENADLNTIIAEIGRSRNINIIADSELSENTVTVNVADVPLIEFLEYLGRNMGVAFHVGSNMIWVTAADPDEPAGAPLETRVYRLRKGLSPMEMPASKDAAGTPNLLEAITRFVSQPPGSDMMWDNRAHALFLKNTRENLMLSEDIIEAMDVVPVQVSIAARFMTVEKTSMRQLGVDWLLNNQKSGTPAGFLLGNRQTTLSRTLSMGRAGSRASTSGGDMSSSQNSGESMSFNFNNGMVNVNNNSSGSNSESSTAGRSRTSGADTSMAFNISSESGLNNLANNAFSGIIGGAGGDFSYQTILGKFAVNAVVHALEESGKSQTLAQPRVTTLNNSPAEFFKGEIFRWYEDYELSSYSSSAGGYGNGSSSSGTGLVPTGEPKEEELGYTLNVTPSVGADLASINLILYAKISSFKNWEYYMVDNGANADGEAAGQTALKLPIFLQSHIDTQVNIRSGETIILGGMIDSYQSHSVRGVPFLSKLPFIGSLFKTEVTENVPSNLLIFVTATIISDTGEELISINPQVLPGLPIPEDYYAAESGGDEEIPEPAPPVNDENADPETIP
ncbi:MAG: hypothetical protein FWF96_02175 [Kiritimatiellaeota bacterium]|nr:hypothetical protein [Kiritimatiellota bacterium]